MISEIKSRRSIRKYQEKPLEESVLRQIIESGFYAPTARGIGPWHFIIVEDREKLEKIKSLCPNMSMLSSAPCAVFVCGDSDLSPDYWPDDSAAATMNMLLTAKSLGVGSCWCAVYPNPQRMNDLADLFDLPENIKVYNGIALGYPNEEKTAPQRVDESRIHKF